MRSFNSISRFLMAAVLIVTSFLPAACASQTVETKPQASPDTTFARFTEAWAGQDYSAMYQLLSSESKLSIAEADFTERYAKIMQGIEASELDFEMAADGLARSDDQASATIAFSVQMDTLAGRLDLTGYTMNLVQETASDANSKEKIWTIHWSEELIFPGMGPTDKVRVRRIEPIRGEIFDRKGQGLAVNGELTTIGVVPSRFDPVREEALPQMAELLGISEERIEKALSGASNPDWFYPVVTLAANANQLSAKLTAIDGVQYQKTAGRIYPAGASTGLLTGYIGPITAEELEKLAGKRYLATDRIGKMGLEQVYEERLRGQPGGEIIIVGEDGQRVKQQIALRDAVDGETIQLTIDLSTQYALYRQMQADAGAAAAVDPLSGEILALVSTPSFDPNLLQTYVPDAVQTSWNEAVKPYFSSRFKQVYAPGSVFKLVTAAIGLNTGTLDPEEALEISGLKWRPDSSWGTYAVTRVKDPGQPIDLLRAFLYSDNIYFAQQALAIGDAAFVQGAQGFGIGEDLPVDYPFNPSQLANDGLANPVLLADTGYGQGEVLVSPLHLALFYSTLATEGNLLKPFLEYREGNEPEVWKKQAIAAKHVPLLTEALLAVVEDPAGTGYTKDGSDHRLLGKTGTAELKQSLEDESAEENGWFVALNVDEPRLAIAMMIEDVKTRGGSHYVVPLVKKAMDEALAVG